MKLFLRLMGIVIGIIVLLAIGSVVFEGLVGLLAIFWYFFWWAIIPCGIIAICVGRKNKLK